MGACTTKLNESTLQQNSIIKTDQRLKASNIIIEIPKIKINEEEKKSDLIIKEQNNKENTDLTHFPEFYYFAQQSGQLFLISKDSTVEIIVKFNLCFPQDAALGYLSDRTIISVGGTLKNIVVPLVVSINPSSQRAIELPSLLMPCKQGQVHEIGDWVYYIGGIADINGSIHHAPLMRYNLKQKMWQDLYKVGEQFKFNRIINMGTCAIGNKLVIIGGQRKGKTGRLKNSKKIYSIGVENGFKLELEAKLPIKLLKPLAATGSKHGIITGGLNSKDLTYNRLSFCLISKNSNFYVFPIESLAFDLNEPYPAIYAKEFAMFISFPNIAIRNKHISNWIGYQITGKTTRIEINMPNIKPTIPESESSEESVQIENESKVFMTKYNAKSASMANFENRLKKENYKNANNKERKIKDLSDDPHYRFSDYQGKNNLPTSELFNKSENSCDSDKKIVKTGILSVSQKIENNFTYTENISRVSNISEYSPRNNNETKYVTEKVKIPSMQEEFGLQSPLFKNPELSLKESPVNSFTFYQAKDDFIDKIEENIPQSVVSPNKQALKLPLEKLNLNNPELSSNTYYELSSEINRNYVSHIPVRSISTYSEHSSNRKEKDDLKSDNVPIINITNQENIKDKEINDSPVIKFNLNADIEKEINSIASDNNNPEKLQVEENEVYKFNNSVEFKQRENFENILSKEPPTKNTLSMSSSSGNSNSLNNTDKFNSVINFSSFKNKEEESESKNNAEFTETDLKNEEIPIAQGSIQRIFSHNKQSSDKNINEVLIPSLQFKFDVQSPDIEIISNPTDKQSLLLQEEEKNTTEIEKIENKSDVSHSLDIMNCPKDDKISVLNQGSGVVVVGKPEDMKDFSENKIEKNHFSQLPKLSTNQLSVNKVNPNDFDLNINLIELNQENPKYSMTSSPINAISDNLTIKVAQKFENQENDQHNFTKTFSQYPFSLELEEITPDPFSKTSNTVKGDKINRVPISLNSKIISNNSTPMLTLSKGAEENKLLSRNKNPFEISSDHPQEKIKDKGPLQMIIDQKYKKNDNIFIRHVNETNSRFTKNPEIKEITVSDFIPNNYADEKKADDNSFGEFEIISGIGITKEISTESILALNRAKLQEKATSGHILNKKFGVSSKTENQKAHDIVDNQRTAKLQMNTEEEKTETNRLKPFEKTVSKTKSLGRITLKKFTPFVLSKNAPSSQLNFILKSDTKALPLEKIDEEMKLKNEEKAKTLAIIEENPDENPITSNRDGKNNHYRDLLNNKEFVLSVLCPQNVLKLLQIITLEFNLHPISNVESFQSFHDLTKYLRRILKFRDYPIKGFINICSKMHLIPKKKQLSAKQCYLIIEKFGIKSDQEIVNSKLMAVAIIKAFKIICIKKH